MLIPTIASRYIRLRRHDRTYSIRLLQSHPATNASTPNLQLAPRSDLPDLKLTGPKRIVFRHVLSHTSQRAGQILKRVRPAFSRVEILHMYKGLSFVIKGAETGYCIRRSSAEDFGQGFNDAHQHVFAVYGWRLVPEVDC